MKKSKNDIKKEDIIKDIQELAKKYRKEFGEEAGYVTRDYYLKYGKYNKTQVDSTFGNFTNAKSAAISEDDVDTDSLILQKKVIQLEEKTRDLEKEKKELLKRSINEDDLVELYDQQIKPIQLCDPIKFTSIKEDNRNKEAILMLSDFHLGEVVIPEEVNFANEYNSKIMIKRLDRIFYYLQYYCELFKIKKLNLLFLGDLLSGAIHNELVRTNELNEVDAIFFLQEYLTKKLLEIENSFSSINIEFVVGNHGRFSVKPEHKTAAKLNWEYILAKQLQSCFEYIQKEDKKININISPSLYKIVTIAGRSFLISHGTFMTGSGTGGFAGIPYYSLAMTGAKLYGALEQIGVKNSIKFQDILLAHLHTTASVGMFNGGTLRINGCLIGTNEFSLNKMKSSAKVEQTMLIVEDGNVNQEIILRGIE